MPSSPEYPPELETAWIQHAMRVTGARVPRLAVERLASAAGSLSDAFTTGRDPGFSGYRSDRRALAAYGLFFFPRAYVRTRQVVRECLGRHGWPADGDALRLLDLGAGTGAAGLACLHELSLARPRASLQLDMVDCAREGIDLSRSIFSAGRALWPHAGVHERTGDARDYRPERRAHIILCSFAINEWMEAADASTLADWVSRQMESLVPGGWLVIIEPALRASVERIERLRDWVAAEKNMQIMAPCPHHEPCPMLAKKRGWCHEVRHWPVPESLRWINRSLRRDVHLLKYSFLALRKHPPETSSQPWMRLISPVREEKGKFAFHGCGADGHIHSCEWLTRHLSGEQHALSRSLERGDQIVATPERILGDGVTERIAGPPEIRKF